MRTDVLQFQVLLLNLKIFTDINKFKKLIKLEIFL